MLMVDVGLQGPSEAKLMRRTGTLSSWVLRSIGDVAHPFMCSHVLRSFSLLANFDFFLVTICLYA